MTVLAVVNVRKLQMLNQLLTYQTIEVQNVRPVTFLGGEKLAEK